ncbi:MAG: ATP-binding protein [Deltaproteobacteria bacterium]|nr:ATP-binding protein [Deltaproteobacteria bacterium]
METGIRQRLLALNPWMIQADRYGQEVERRLPRTFIPRNLDISDFHDTTRAKLVVGPRQAGKSTLVWSSLRDRDPRTVLFLNAEETLVRRWCTSASAMVRGLEEELPSVRTLFIDEAQHLDEAGLVVKGLVDARRDLDIIVTGSSSFHLMARTRESLAGRAIRRVLLPLSIGEIVSHRAPATPAARRELAIETSRKLMVQGGYPGVWTSSSPARLLSDLMEAYVYRDASDLFRIRRPDAFRRLLQLAAGQVGQMVNLSEWASILGVSASTVRQYLEILEETWVVRLLPAFAGGRRAEITSAARVHFYDPGLRNAVLGAFDDPATRPDRGPLLEALSFSEIVKVLPTSWSLHYWRSKGGAEMDFVLAHGRRIVAIEVKSRPRTTRSSRSFIEAYEPEHLLLVTSDDLSSTPAALGNTRILTVPVTDLATTLASVL